MLNYLKIFFLISFLVSYSQSILIAQIVSGNNEIISVHQEQMTFYRQLGKMSSPQYDSINKADVDLVNIRSKQDFNATEKAKEKYLSDIGNDEVKALNKRVFGYHPYWSGTRWKQYHWDLITDLCYFSYDVDPSSGNAIDLYDLLTDPVIDTALKHNVRVHLCVTLFSGHAQFFQSSNAQQHLILNLLSLMEERGLHGINIDFEAMPSANSEAFTDFIQSLSIQLHESHPDAELSIASPAINWNNTFNLPALNPWVDLFMIMTYDYYWSGSDLAGPVAGLWPLTSSFNYSTAHSITYYETEGVNPAKILMGVAYYGRDWPVNGSSFPSNASGIPTTLTYSQITSGINGNYIPSHLRWDDRSYNPYYFYNSGGWRECFFDNTCSLARKYDLVNRRLLAGIGIWALGYDNGREELWNLIDDKFRENNSDLCVDTLFDTGGPVWSYKNDQTYTEVVRTSEPGQLTLEFPVLSLESGYDSLWVYDGDSEMSPLLAALSGTEIPVKTSSSSNILPTLLSTSSNVFTIRFKSDSQTPKAGYEIIWNCPTASIDNNLTDNSIKVYPNPALSGGLVSVNVKDSGPVAWQIFDLSGKKAGEGNINSGYILLPERLTGFYILRLDTSKGFINQKLVIK